MRKVLVFAAMVLIGLAATASADGKVFLYVDAAPNVYGSPAYPAWRAQAFQAAASDTFVNMASSVNWCHVGTTGFEIEDEVVYSFGDLGKRLTWVYWIPGETTASLAGRFEIALFNTWDGEFLDFYDYYYGSTWLVPTSWVDYDADGDTIPDGVIGAAGMAWWGAYGVNTPEALENDLAEWGLARERWEFKAMLDGQEYSIVSDRLPVRTTTLNASCAETAKNHGQFVQCVAKQTNALQKAGVISGKEKGAIQSCAAQTPLP